MKITKNQLKQIIKEELTAALNESPRPPLFGPGRAPEMFYPDYQGTRAIDAAPDLRDFASGGDAMPGSKMINIKRVFNAEGDVLDREAGADLTAQTIKLLAATQAGLPPEGTHIDVTVDMDGKVIGAQVAKKLGEPRA